MTYTITSHNKGFPPLFIYLCLVYEHKVTLYMIRIFFIIIPTYYPPLNDLGSPFANIKTRMIFIVILDKVNSESDHIGFGN